MSYIFGLFELWSFSFWLLFLLFSILAFFAAEKQYFLFPSVVGFVLLLSNLEYFKPTYIKNYLIFGFLYFIIGVVWSIWRWRAWVKQEITKHRIKNLDELNEVRYLFEPGRIKSEITGWIIFWPYSLLWNFSHDFVELVFDLVKNTYQKISDKILDNFIKQNFKQK